MTGRKPPLAGETGLRSTRPDATASALLPFRGGGADAGSGQACVPCWRKICRIWRLRPPTVGHRWICGIISMPLPGLCGWKLIRRRGAPRLAGRTTSGGFVRGLRTLSEWCCEPAAGRGKDGARQCPDHRRRCSTFARAVAGCLSRQAFHSVSRSLAEAASSPPSSRAMESVAEFYRLLRPGAEIRLATDDPQYLHWILVRLTAHPGFAWQARRPRDWHSRPPDWPATRYERKAISAGRQPAFLRFCKRSATQGGAMDQRGLSNDGLGG